ncbi:hypothetical protein EUTSA_v10026488mg [Eutrema salsugineum]|uniref:Uncharacterized protein n=1 Tax=Eutrema salsugineum TaxID=72664 RepID=V4MLI1_EUTSA|nr:uncharacterized protein LOC18028234 [Eutrema salsugineum]ESQ53568.1 hypothetical protein EUTSA_v10026488mg [Eutrema salsugineum]
MSSMMETLQIRKPASLPVSQRSTSSSSAAAAATDDEPGLIRRRLSSLSLNLSSQPAAIAARFPRSKSVSAMGEQAGSSVKEWWEWGWSWILSRKPIFIRDLELNKDEAKSIGSQNRGSIMHVFFKIRSQIRNLMGSSSDTLPLSCKYKRQR